MSGQTGRESDKFMLRLPDGMRDRIKYAADLNKRSMNAEIIATLETAYPAQVFDADTILGRVEMILLHKDADAKTEEVALANFMLERSEYPLRVEFDGERLSFVPAPKN